MAIGGLEVHAEYNTANDASACMYEYVLCSEYIYFCCIDIGVLDFSRLA